MFCNNMLQKEQESDVSLFITLARGSNPDRANTQGL